MEKNAPALLMWARGSGTVVGVAVWWGGTDMTA